jgi:glyoxylase I family protein
MSFHVERIDHVVLRVRSLPAMVAFYERALGFKVVRRLDRLKLVQMRAGASMLDLIDKERGGAPENEKQCNMDHLCFRVEPFDRDAIAARLSPFGITLGETVERFGAEGTGPSVYFDDPEGNQIELKGPATSGMPTEGAAQ